MVLASSCGLASDGAEVFETFEESDGSVDDGNDGGARPDGSSDGGKDASPDSGGTVTDAGADADDGSDGSSDAGDDADAGDDTDAGDDASTDDPDASDGSDSGTLPDAGEPDASGPCVVGTDPCDMDCDGDLSIACGGDDCCDTDPNVFVGQTEFFEAKSACGSFDYNCDGAEEKELGLGKACSRPTWENRCDAPKIGFKGTIPECGKPGIKFVGCTGRTFTGGCGSVEEAVLQTCR